MIKLEANNEISFDKEDLKAIYEPIVTQYGFEYDEGLDSHKRGLMWSKLYEGEDGAEDLWPIMIITESSGDHPSIPDEGSFFSTRLYWDSCFTSNPGLTVHANPREWGDEYADDDRNDGIAQLVHYALAAQKEVNEVLEECRKQLVAKLTEIRNTLIAEGEK